MYTAAPTTTRGLSIFSPDSSPDSTRGESPDLSIFLFAHRVYRTEFARLAMVAAANDTHERRIEAIEEHIALMTRSLNTHHIGEDERIFPLLRERDQAAAVVLDAVEDDHEAIDPLIAAATDTAVPLRSRAGVLAELSDLLGRHIDREEAEAVPLICRHISHAEWEAEGKTHVKEARAELPTFVCLMIENMSPDEVSEMLSTGPKALVLIYKLSWRRRWAKRRELIYGD